MIQAPEAIRPPRTAKGRNGRPGMMARMPIRTADDGERARIAAQLIDDRLVGGAGGAAARNEQAGSERDDQRRDLRDQTVTDRELDEDVGRLGRSTCRGGNSR